MENIPLKIGEKGLSINYFANFGVKCHFPKLGCRESSFLKKKGVSVIYPKYKNKVLMQNSTKRK